MNSTAVTPMTVLQHPYRVTAPGGKLHLLIMNASDGLPAAFALMGTNARDKIAVRISGGCKGMNAEDKAEMLDYFAHAFDGYGGVVWSGATRQFKEEAVDPMVTDVPGVIAAFNPGCVALGTLPRVDLLSLQGDSRLVLDQYGTGPNPSMSGILIVQNGPDGKLDWDGDLNAAFGIMENWRQYANFQKLGFIGWNGGPITYNEVVRSAKLGYLTTVVQGSGRAADEIASAIQTGNSTLGGKILEGSINVVPRENPQQLRDLLIANGFLRQ